MTFSQRLAACAVLGLLLLTACGQKGPLFMPGEKPPEKESR
jgi:predicted small lipoprotein YifL